MEPLGPVFTAGLFPPLHAELVALLRSQSAGDWERPTVAGEWRVRDVAAHLLDGALRTVATYRDGHAQAPDEPITGYADVVRLIDRLNADGVRYAGRLSPRLIVELLDVVGPMLAETMAAVPPFADAVYPVAWAGEARSEGWMDVGRQYTEQWHHQAQIRAAVGAPGLLDRRWLHPLLDLSVRALPRAYASIAADEGTAVALVVDGDAGGAWSVLRRAAGWEVVRGEAEGARATVRLSPDAAWRLFYNAPQGVVVEGDADLAAPLLAARSVMV